MSTCPIAPFSVNAFFAAIKINCMKKTLLAVALASTAVTYAQKYDRESFTLNKTHLPEKLVYDQLKTYGTYVNLFSSSVNTDYNYVNGMVGNLTSFDKVDYNNADMQIKAYAGPYSFVEEKTVSRSVTEEVNKQKVTVTYYKRVHTFRFPAGYTVMNRKNGLTLYNTEYANSNIRTIEGNEYKSEADAAKTFESEKSMRLTNDINEHLRLFFQGANGKIKDMYDFYPTQYSMTIFQFKKWDKDDEYNEHIKNIKKTMAVMTADEAPALYMSRLEADINYLKSFEGMFNPKDKKEDILFFGNYFNLATIYYSLDDIEKAKYYLAKLDSVDKREDFTNSLKQLIERTERRMNKHFLATTHLNYNPVKDYKLAGKSFTSDALSSSEAAAQSMAQGNVEPTDIIKWADGKEEKGKFVIDAGWLKFISAANPQPTTITPVNAIWFKKDTMEYVVAKSNDAAATKNFYRVYYSSDKIKLLQLVNGMLVENASYTGIIRPKEDFVTFIMGMSIKKKLEKYFEDCPLVSKKAGDGDYGGAMSKDKMIKFVEMCKDYASGCGVGTN